jgi:hypothetical protein
MKKHEVLLRRRPWRQEQVVDIDEVAVRGVPAFPDEVRRGMKVAP